jgi:hypothetical protein
LEVDYLIGQQKRKCQVPQQLRHKSLSPLSSFFTVPLCAPPAILYSIHHEVHHGPFTKRMDPHGGKYIKHLWDGAFGRLVSSNPVRTHESLTIARTFKFI